MNDKIIEFDKYKNLFENKNNLDNKTKTVEDLSLEELEDVSKLYKGEIYKVSQEIKDLEERNRKLKRVLEK